jgi:hypothetical protein
MSDCVFVQDAEGRPLMPTARAYARTLVRDGKAGFISHPALSIIQLTHTVAEPTVQPVLLGIRMHAPVASLLVFTERTGLVPLIHLAVGCQHLEALDCDEPSHDPQFINLLTIKAVVETIGTLMTLLPITYLMGSNPEPTQRKSPMDMLLNNLLAFGVHVLDRQEEDILPETDNAIALYYASAEVTRATDIAEASVLAYHWYPLPNDRPRVIAQVQDGNRTRIGLLYRIGDDMNSTLHIPLAATWQGITWQRRPQMEVDFVRPWPVHPLSLLPMESRQPIPNETEAPA